MTCTKLLPLFVILLIFSCQQKPKSADLLLINATVYTANDALPKTEAIAVTDGRVTMVGTNQEIMAYKGDSTSVMDMNGKFIYPGFIEGHAHIMGVGANLINVDLMGAQSYDEVIEMVKKRANETPEGEWIIGRG